MKNNLNSIQLDILVFLALASLMILKLAAPCVYAQSDSFVAPTNPLKGRIIFEKKECVKCHAVFGYGEDGGPDLGRAKFYGSLLDLAGIMWNHSPQMSKQMRIKQVMRPNFTKEEMYSLLAYLYFLPYLGDVGNAKKGQVLLSTKDCLKCHSLGKTGGRQASDLNSLGRYASPLFIAQSMWNHSPQMESKTDNMSAERPHLTGQEIVDISAFIRKMNPHATREKIYMSPGNPQAGAHIFEIKNCSKCHSNEKAKNKKAPNLEHSNLRRSVLEIAALLWNHGPEMLQLMRTKGLDYPLFEGKEMADLIAYLYFLGSVDNEGRADLGKDIFIRNGCHSCHDVEGQKQLIGPNAMEITRTLTPISMVQIMWNHAGIMQTRMLEMDLPWPEFQKDEMKHLYSYLKLLATYDRE